MSNIYPNLIHFSYLQFKKEKILNEYCYTEEDDSNNMSVVKIAESFMNEGGTATKYYYI
jgi:hypothetical protein